MDCEVIRTLWAATPLLDVFVVKELFSAPLAPRRDEAIRRSILPFVVALFGTEPLVYVCGVELCATLLADPLNRLKVAKYTRPALCDCFLCLRRSFVFGVVLDKVAVDLHMFCKRDKLKVIHAIIERVEVFVVDSVPFGYRAEVVLIDLAVQGRCDCLSVLLPLCVVVVRVLPRWVSPILNSVVRDNVHSASVSRNSPYFFHFPLLLIKCSVVADKRRTPSSVFISFVMMSCSPQSCRFSTLW